LRARTKVEKLPDFETERWSVAEVRVADLNGDGKKDVAALFNFNCTADPGELFLLCSVGDRFVVQMLDTEWATLDESLRDLDGDGKLEVILNRMIEGNSAHCNAFFWHDVFVWTKGGYRPSGNARFVKSYYLRHYLPLVDSHVSRAQELLASQADRRDLGQAVAMLEDSAAAIGHVAALLPPMEYDAGRSGPARTEALATPSSSGSCEVSEGAPTPRTAPWVIGALMVVSCSVGLALGFRLGRMR
jgi:hypothetical protein